MIQGIGIDIELISRVKSSLDRLGNAFIERIFTEEEKKYCTGKGNPPQHFAARFAAKEAFAKAIGTGWSGNFRWKDVEVTSDERGKPNLRLHHEMHDHFAGSVIHLSLSHTTDYVAAIVVIEQIEKQ